LGSQLIPASHVSATVAHRPRADYLSGKHGVEAHTSNRRAVSGADLVLVCLKPQQVKGFLQEVRRSLRKDALVISAAASVTTELSAQTLLGASALVLHTGEHPAKLKDVVTTPAGCTIDGLLELEEGGLRVTLIKAVVRAAERAKQLVESHNS